MECISCQPLSSSLLLLPEYKYKHQIWPANRPIILQVKKICYSSVSLSSFCKAIPSPLFVAATSPPAGKLSVLLQTSGVCLIAYWVTNFVVPGFILKDLQSKKGDEDGENSGEDER